MADYTAYIEKLEWLRKDYEKANKAFIRADEKRTQAEKDYRRYVNSNSTVETIKKYSKALSRASSFRATKLEQREFAYLDLMRYISYLKGKGIIVK